MEQKDIRVEKEHDGDGVEYLVAANEIVENIVGRSVAAHQEHIVIIGGEIHDVSQHAERRQNPEHERDIFLFHTVHFRKRDIERAEARNGVGDARNDVVHRQDGVGVIVLSCAVRAKNCAENAEHEHEIECGFLQFALRECCDRQGKQLNAAQKQRQKVKNLSKAVFAAQANDDNFKQLKRVNGDSRDD